MTTTKNTLRLLLYLLAGLAAAAAVKLLVG